MKPKYELFINWWSQLNGFIDTCKISFYLKHMIINLIVKFELSARFDFQLSNNILFYTGFKYQSFYVQIYYVLFRMRRRRKSPEWC